MRFSSKIGFWARTLGVLALIGTLPVFSALAAPSRPGAQQLIAGTRQAALHRGSWHFDVTDQIQNGAFAQNVHEYGDVVLAPHEARIRTDITSPNGPALMQQPVTTELIEVGKTVTTRLPKGKWKCSSVNPRSDQFAAVLNILPPKVTNAKLLGPTTMDAHAVWHIHASTPITLNGKTYGLPTDLYIARADGTLVEQDMDGQAKTSKASLHEREIVHFSHYGQRASIRLPASCQK